MVLAQAGLGKDVAEAQQEAKKAKTLGELVEPYLRLRETGNEFWKAMRPKSHVETTRYLQLSWQPLHDKPVNGVANKAVVPEGCESPYHQLPGLDG